MNNKLSKQTLTRALFASSLLATAIANADYNGYPNLALGAGADGSSKGDGSYGNVVDGDLSSYWQPSGTSGERIGVKNVGESFNTVVIRELNNATNSWRLTDHDSGEVLASGSTLGAEAVISGFGDRNLYKVNLIIDSASTAPRIAEFELYSASGNVGGSSSSSSSSAPASSSSSSSTPNSGGTGTTNIQEQRTGFCQVEGAIESEHNGFTGSGYANTENATGAGIEWRVSSPRAGSNALIWRFANAGGDRPAEVLINGNSQGTINMNDTGAWTTYSHSDSFRAELNAGENSIRLQATGSGGLANIDFMSVVGADPSGVSCDGGNNSSSSSSSAPVISTVQLQEQSAGFCSVDGTVDSNHSGYTGAGFANTENASGEAIRYSVNAGASDTYSLQVRYASGSGDRPAEVFVNGTSQGYLDMYDTGAWSSWTETGEFTINLAEGENTVHLVAASGGGLPNIDRVSVTGIEPAAGECGDNPPSSSSSSSPSGGGDITGSSCVSTGSTSVSSTIRVSGGDYDGQCRTFNPTSALGDGSQDEGQDPVFRVENGATLRNVIIGNNGADGVHVYNGGTLDNILWTNVGEDAMTIKSSGTVYVRNVEGYNGEDKFIQVNAESDLHVENCIVDNMGKFLRQNGGSNFELNVTVDRCQISDMNEGIFRSDSENSTAHISNSRLQDAGNVCIGDWDSCTSSNLSNF